MAFDVRSLQQAAANSNFGAPPTGNLDIARYIVSHANADWNKASAINPNAGKPGSPSILSRIMDLMSRPSYAVDEMARRFIEHTATNYNPTTGNQDPINPGKYNEGFLQSIGDILHGGASGLAGTQKTTWAKTLTELNPNSSPVARYGGGFLLDLVTDPTSYVGPGLIKSAVRGGKALFKGAEALNAAEKGLPESKGIVSIVNGRQRVPVPANDARALPEALNRASSQVKIPDFHAPGSVQAPTNFPKVNLDLAKFGLPTKTLEDLPNPPTKLTPDQINKLSGGSSRKAAQIFGQIYRDKGYKVDPKSIERTLAKLPKSAIGDYLTEAKNAPVRAAGLAEQEAKAAENAQRLRFMSKSRAPIVGKFGTVNVTRAGDILDKIKNGDLGVIPQVVKKTSNVSPATGIVRDIAGETARDFEKNVLSKPNKFPVEAGKAPAVNNPAQQANLFLRYATKVAPTLISGAKNPNAAKFMAKRYTDAYRMQQVAEDYFRSKGLHPTFWDGTKVALTHVIDELGGPAKMTQEHMTQLITAFKNRDPSKIVNPEIRQAIENVRAQGALEDSQWVKKSLDINAQKASVAQQVLSPGKYNDFVRNLINKNKTVMSMATDASPASISSAQKLMTEILQRNGTLPQLATDAKKTYIQLYVTPDSKKIKWLPVAEAQTRALEKTIGTNPAKLGKTVDHDNMAAGWFLSRMATWYGQKDLRPDVLIHTATAMNNAAARAEIWNKVAKTYTPDEISEAFKIAAGHIASPSSQRTSDLGMQIQKAMENLFTSTGISKEAQKAASVAMRSGALIKDLNEQLRLVKSPFRFTQAKDVKNFMGKSRDFSKGTEWLKSWEWHNPKDPLDFIMRVETATEQLMHKYSFLDETAARYGSKLRSKIFSTPVATAGKTALTKEVTIGRLDGVYFPRELAPQIDRAISTWHAIYDPKSDLMRFIDRVTKAWKSGVTIYAPSHHIRNFIGDAVLSWWAGVNNPRVYDIAARVMHSQRSRYDALETINNLTDKNALKSAMTRPGNKVLTTKGGIDLTAEQLYIAAHSHGLLAKVSVIEDLIGDPLIKAQPFNGKVKHIAQSASELREHFVRMAHFTDYLMKSTEKDLPRLFASAAKEVRKWHPDGMDLTKFEREKLKRIFPFYSWTRKAVPLLIESAVTRPGKVLAYPRAMYAIQGMNGIQSPSVTDPFPQDQLFPDWIKAKGIGPVLGAAGNYTIVNPSNPFQDVVSQYLGTGKPQDIFGGIGGSVNPLARIPAELATGNTTLGTPVYNDFNSYLTQQIPIAGMASRLTNIGIGGVTNKGQKQGIGNEAAIINFLTALGVQPTAPYIKQAQIELKQKRKKAQQNG